MTTTTSFRKERLDHGAIGLLQRVGHVSLEPNPALLEHAQKRAESVQNRIADEITRFAGSMWFVYIHIIWFSCWIGLGVEKYPVGWFRNCVVVTGFDRRSVRVG
jgi:hypothetical protein